MNTPLYRFLEVGEVIDTDCECNDYPLALALGDLSVSPWVPCKHSLGRSVRPENVGYLRTTRPHTEQSTCQMKERLGRDFHKGPNGVEVE